MKTNHDQAAINYTFQRVAALCGLRLSYYLTAALLGFSFLFLAIIEHRSASPLYILLSLALLPSLLKSMLFPADKPQTQKRENTLAFPLFCKKYRYDYPSYKAMNLAYLLTFVLLAAWHISYSQSTDLPTHVTLLPMGIAVLSLLTRLFGTLGYLFYFHFFPEKAMR